MVKHPLAYLPYFYRESDRWSASYAKNRGNVNVWNKLITNFISSQPRFDGKIMVKVKQNLFGKPFLKIIYLLRFVPSFGALPFQNVSIRVLPF